VGSVLLFFELIEEKGRNLLPTSPCRHIALNTLPEGNRPGQHQVDDNCHGCLKSTLWVSKFLLLRHASSLMLATRRKPLNSVSDEEEEDTQPTLESCIFRERWWYASLSLALFQNWYLENTNNSTGYLGGPVYKESNFCYKCIRKPVIKRQQQSNSPAIFHLRLPKISLKNFKKKKKSTQRIVVLI
jgi:hypothetical protein